MICSINWTTIETPDMCRGVVSLQLLMGLICERKYARVSNREWVLPKRLAVQWKGLRVREFHQRGIMIKWGYCVILRLGNGARTKMITRGYCVILRLDNGVWTKSLFRWCYLWSNSPERSEGQFCWWYPARYRMWANGPATLMQMRR